MKLVSLMGRGGCVVVDGAGRIVTQKGNKVGLYIHLFTLLCRNLRDKTSLV